MRTTELAKQAGVNPQTLRYYERRGLLPAPDRSLGGHRNYDRASLDRVRAIKVAQRLGFRLDEVGELIDLGAGASDLQARAAAKVRDIDARLEELTAIRAALVSMADADCDHLLTCACSACPVPFASQVSTAACTC